MHHRVKGSRWLRVWGVAAVVVVVVVVSAANGSCVDTTTNFCEKYGIRCEANQQCALDQAVCIEIGGCGDGTIDKNKDEVCDDGNIVDGEMVNGVFVPDNCSADCKSTQECGNGIQDTGETCDNGRHNGVSDDPCDILCQLRNKVCGDGILDLDFGEQCDPGVMDSAGCNSFLAGSRLGCTFSKCGDGYRNLVAEGCDSGGMITANCNGPLCTIPVCGDHFQNAAFGEECDSGSSDTKGCNGDGNNDINNDNNSKCHIPICGDGYTNALFKPPGSKNVEECDTHGDSTICNGNGNGNDENKDDSKCRMSACGDGYLNQAAKEICDPGGGGGSDPELGCSTGNPKCVNGCTMCM